MLQGSMVAIVTPFKNDTIDEPAFRKLIEFQVENGTQVIVPCGTTGESSTLSVEEHHRVIEMTVQAVKGRVKVLAGTGSNNTVEAVELTRAAKAAGADASLQIVPYYNKPTQEGVYRHFMRIAEAADFPLVLYNIQSRTGINVLPDTIARLAAACPLLIGVKEASGNLEQISRLHALLPEQVAILSGDDALTLPIMAVGGKGVISVVANIAPRQTAACVQKALAGDFHAALPLHEKLLPLIRALFLETSPAPVKAAMEFLGLCSGEIRLPLVSVTEATRTQLRQAMQDFGLLS
ncbi:4-hydroxy-tetrahydrodipicolinate synthase [candidate division FCPU426 bacterium]|nr:4-hydroxy-tetrahydrodipicolinate synthase [candidate division FCPU426 bacterium]